MRTREKTHEPKFEQRVDERCEDCEINGYLTNDGFPRKGAPVNRCSRCTNGRVTLVTWDMIRQKPTLIDKLNHKGWKLVLRSELLDPYMIRKKG